MPDPGQRTKARGILQWGLVCLLLAGTILYVYLCRSPEVQRSRFVGRWQLMTTQPTRELLEFRADGTGTVSYWQLRRKRLGPPRDTLWCVDLASKSISIRMVTPDIPEGVEIGGPYKWHREILLLTHTAGDNRGPTLYWRLK